MSVDIMIDLETTGTSAGCVVLSIGACTFDLSMDFYSKISLNMSSKLGLTTDYHTMAWWNKQAVDVRTEAFSGTESPVTAVGRLTDWIKQVRAKHGGVYVWGNGADFDLPILKAVYEKCGMTVPWGPFTGRCYRTLKELPQLKHIELEKDEGVKHNALADARNQAVHAVKLLSYLKSMDSVVSAQKQSSLI